jgi:hypothetical protein
VDNHCSRPSSGGLSTGARPLRAKELLVSGPRWARGRIRYRKLRGGHRDDRTEAARSRSDGGHADEVISRPSLLGCLFCSWFAGVVAAAPDVPAFVVIVGCLPA